MQKAMTFQVLSAVSSYSYEVKCNIWHDANIAEDLVLRDVNRRKEAVISSVHCTKSYNSSSSSQPQNGGSNHGLCERGVADSSNELLVDTGSVISNPSYISAVVPFFLKG